MTRAENYLYCLLSSAQNYCFCLGQESLEGWRVDVLFGMMFMLHVVLLSHITIPWVNQIAHLYDLLPFIQFSSVAQLCLTLCDPMNRSTPGLPVHHQLPEFTQTHVPRVGDAIQPSHPLSSPSPPAPNPSQHHSLFQ